MSSQIKFSVAMCVYNGDNPEWFCQAVDSVVTQSVSPDEIILVVDGPVNEKLDYAINTFAENISSLKVIRLPENMGHGIARRTSIGACTNDLIALMDADDISISNRFEEQLKAFEKDDYDVVGGNISEFIDIESNVVAHRCVPENDKDIKTYLKYRCPFNQMTVMMNKRRYEDAGGYLDWYCDEDYYLWIRMYMSGAKFYNIQDTLVNVRVGRDMYKRRGGLRYFKSEAALQKFMLNQNIININEYFINVLKRFIVQVLLPNSIRGFVFKTFARSK